MSVARQRAAEDCRTPRRFAKYPTQEPPKVLECGSPLPLSYVENAFRIGFKPISKTNAFAVGCWKYAHARGLGARMQGSGPCAIANGGLACGNRVCRSETATSRQTGNWSGS